MNDSDYFGISTLQSKTIKEWRPDERPRERLAMHGAKTLSDAELLAILINSGSKGFSALDAAKSLLEMYQNLTKLVSCDLSELRKTKGIGVARAITLAAAFEIASRIQSEPFDIKKTIRAPEDVASYFIPRFRHLRVETFWILLLTSSNQVIREVKISEGSLNASIVHPREVFRPAIIDSAASIILMHNHPSGNPEPSNSDVEISKKIISAANIFDIQVLDHLIIAGDTFTSLKNRGLI